MRRLAFTITLAVDDDQVRPQDLAEHLADGVVDAMALDQLAELPERGP